MLEVENAYRSIGRLVAVDHCSFRVAEASIAGLIGPNGAGKSMRAALASPTVLLRAQYSSAWWERFRRRGANLHTNQQSSSRR